MLTCYYCRKRSIYNLIMFILNCESDSKAFYILEYKPYILGRKGCDFLITWDTSISKRHAALTLKKGTLEIEDIGSKYNTFVNEVKLECGQAVTLKDGDIIKFGIVNSIYKVQERKLTVICSGLTSANKKKLTQIIKSLNGKMLSTWSSDLSHLTVDKILLTLKVLLAIIEGLPIVSLAFWEKFANCIENNIPPPLETKYLPIASELIHKGLSFEYNSQRKTLFENKVFVFKRKSNLDDIIVSAGGKCILFSDEKISKEKLLGYNPQYILMQEEEQTPDLFHPFNKLVASLVDIKKRAIPQPEIALAVVTCSCAMNCNPDFDRVGSLLQGTSEIIVPSQPLVAESASSQTKSQSCFSTSTNIVSDSMKNAPINQILHCSSENILETEKSEVIEIDEDDKKDAVLEPTVPENQIHSTDGGGMKRIAEANALDSTAKRQKVDGDEQGKNELWVRPSTSKITNSKMTDFFTSTAKEALNNNTMMVEKPAVSQISKRKSSDTEDEKLTLGKRLKMLKNPFASSRDEPSTTTKSISSSKKSAPRQKLLSNSTTKLKSPFKKFADLNTVREPTDRIMKTEQNSRYKVRRLSDEYQIQFPWRSVNDTADVTVKEEPSDTLGILSKSFRDCIIIEKTPLVVERDYRALGYDEVDHTGKPKNFKKFRKVKPLHMQTIILSSFVSVICRKANENDSVNGDVLSEEANVNGFCY